MTTTDHAYHEIKAADSSRRLRFLLRDSALYGFASAASRVVSLITFPILTRFFSNAEYGTVDLLATFGSVAVFFLILGQDSAVARFFFDVEDHEQKRQVVSQALLIQIVLSTAVCIPLFAASPWIADGLRVPAYENALILVVANLPFQMLNNFSRNMLKWTFARRQFLVVTVGGTVAYAVFSVLGAVVFELGVVGIFAGGLVAQVVTAGVGLWFTRGWLTTRVHRNFFRPLMLFGWPYMVTGLVESTLPAIDRATIIGFLDPSSLGLYSAGFRVALLLMMPIMAFQIAWNPMALAIYKEANAKETYDRVLLLATALFSLLALAMALAAEPAIVLLASSRYQAGAVVVVPLVFGHVARSVLTIAGIGIDLSKRTHWAIVSQIIGLATGGLAMLVLVSPFGILGVALGVLVGQLAGAASYIYLGLRAYPLPFALGRPLAIIIVLAVIAALSLALPGDLTAPAIVGRLLFFFGGLTFAWALTRGRLSGQSVAERTSPATRR